MSKNSKFKIVLEGLSGQIEISKLCNKYQISKTTILSLERATTPIWSSGFWDQKYHQERKKITKRKSAIKAYNWRSDHRVKKKRVSIMKRKKSLSVIERNRPVLSFIQSIKAEHPLWGYRRCWAYLYYRQGLMVNKKRIYRLMKKPLYW